MLNRQETFPGHSPFRWQQNEIAAIAAIQPRKRKTLTSETEGLTQAAIENEQFRAERNAAVVFLSSIAALFIRSDKDSFKYRTLVELLRPMVGDDMFQTKAEEIAESDYNKSSTIGARPAIIAALKADASLLFTTDDDRERFAQVMELIASKSTSSQRIGISKIGSDALFRGNDIMARLSVDGEQNALFKPPKEIDTKEKLYSYLQSVFHLNYGQRDPNQSPLLSMEWIAAEALFAARENVGVTQESTAHIIFKRPDHAFLYCYVFGTRQPNMPSSYKPMADQFDAIYTSVHLQGSKNPALLERLRGWTPENGAKNPEQVNGGFQGDTIFFESILFESINGIKKNEPEYQENATRAVAMVRGEPVLFMETLRLLADLLSRRERNLPFPENESTAQMAEVLTELRATFSNHPDRDRIFNGRWFDASAAINPDYQIDMDATLYYMYASKALLLSDAVIQ